VARAFLHVAQAGTGVQVQRGEGVPQRMWRQAGGQLAGKPGGAAEAGKAKACILPPLRRTRSTARGTRVSGSAKTDHAPIMVRFLL
jgi:hypothetical protein